MEGPSIGRQFHRERRAAAWLSRDIHRPAVRDHDSPNEAQTKPEPTLVTTLVAAIEPFPDVREIARRYSNAVSATSRRTTLPSRRALTSTLPPGGVYLIALSIRLAST